eukprot:1447002-Rhodomonas_salina.1
MPTRATAPVWSAALREEARQCHRGVLATAIVAAVPRLQVRGSEVGGERKGEALVVDGVRSIISAVCEVRVGARQRRVRLIQRVLATCACLFHLSIPRCVCCAAAFMCGTAGCYAVPGTDLGYVPTLGCHKAAMLCPVLQSCYAVPGTDLGYAPTRRWWGWRHGAATGRGKRKRGRERGRIASWLRAGSSSLRCRLEAIYVGNAAVYGDRAAIYGTSIAVYGDAAAVYGVNTAVYGVNTAVYAVTAAVYAVNTAVYAVTAAVYGVNAANHRDHAVIYGRSDPLPCMVEF